MTMLSRIMIVDENQLFRDGIKSILCGDGSATVMEAPSFLSAWNKLQIEDSRVDFLLGDPGPDLEGEFDAVRAIARQSPNVKIVILTDQLTPPRLTMAFESGASGILSKKISAEALNQSLHLVLLGDQNCLVDSQRVPAALSSPPRPETLDPAAEILATLSGRENQILGCLVHGLPNKLIARELKMAEATVKVHLKAVLRKIKAQNRTQAAIWAINRGALEFPRNQF
jgi:two-component system nitrate/nitrite response regulator NarL